MESVEQTATIRWFNRAWTEATALLDDGYLESGLSLPEARLVYELAQRSPQPIIELRGRLKLDPGYATRLLDRLAGRNLVTREADPDDRRRQLVSVTVPGREVAALLNRRADARVDELLRPLTHGDREKLVAALDTVAELIGLAPPTPVRIREARPAELGWVLGRHAEVYAEEYGWPDFDAAVTQIVANLMANRDRVWVAERNGRLLGTVSCAEDDAETARLRLLLVEPAARGQRLGARLIDECLAFARTAGYKRIVLHTQDALVAARKLYAAAGFRLDHASVEDSLDPEGKAEHWELDLAPKASSSA
jgi:DNA-binding MarR family transcriptional regulator/N-acetylglutamate synthase-like GNAT family acetyltransferase